MIALVVKATFVLAAAFCAAAGLRRGSAALRHFVWTAALAAILVLPFARLAPQPAPVTAPAIVVAAVGGGSTPATPAPASPSLPWFAIAYGAGAALAAARFLAGSWRTVRLARRGTPSTLGAELGVNVILSEETPMPLAWGILRPLILLPASAAAWPAERLRSVLLHETMHHRRRDLLAQAVAQVACCAYWFHPLAWLALSRQRAEREHACDDAVLRYGVPAHDYAEHLVEAARSAAAARPRWGHAPAMAEASGLERRVTAVLDRRANRRPLTGLAACAVAIAFGVLLAPLAVVTLRAQATATISGIVQDPSGARVPRARVIATNLDGDNVESATANLAGEYRFANIPSGRYTLQVESPRFTRFKQDVTLVTGADLRFDAALRVGTVNESMTVAGHRSTPAAVAPRSTAPQRIRVGGNVQASRLIHQVKPLYPQELQDAGVEGTVMLRAIISKEGKVLQLKLVNSVNPRLAKLAMDAVSQNEYQPTLLNGEPIETMTNIEVHFELGQ